MSKALGHSNSYITHITSGRVNPSVPELLYMIEYLDVSPKTFFSEIEETESRSILLQKAIDKLERYSEDDLTMILPVLERIKKSNL
jgi:transcriptional regulator with XRE-family HTH domain